MQGWKTNTGALLALLGQVLVVAGVSPEIANAVTALGGALATVGIGHKLERVATGINQ